MQTVEVSRKVLVVDDEPIMATLLASALETGGFQTLTCASVREAREVIDDFDPDAAVLDISLGHGMTGIDLAHVLQHTNPGVAVLLLTKHADLRAAGHTEAGLPPNCGLLRKQAVTEVNDLIAAVEALLAEQPVPTASKTGPLAQLTAQQIAVLRMAAQGYTNSEIARQRGRTANTVEKMLLAIYRKLGVETNSEVSPRVEAIRVFINAEGMPERP